MRDADFVPLDPGPLRDGDLVLALSNVEGNDPARNRVPRYSFAMQNADTGEVMGRIRLRITDGWEFSHHNGHIGFDVDEAHRGRRYAARSARLLLPLARAHGLPEIWITCGPENAASARSCKLAGGVYVDTIEVPDTAEMYARGIRLRERYRLDTGAA